MQRLAALLLASATLSACAKTHVAAVVPRILVTPSVASSKVAAAKAAVVLPAVSLADRLTGATLKDPTQTRLHDTLMQDVPALAEATSDVEIARLLRDHLYHIATLAPDGVLDFPFTADTYAAVKSGTTPLLCGGFAEAYAALVGVFAIPVHVVQVSSAAADGSVGVDNHVFTEVQIGGRWQVEDPTFNVEWQVNGVPIDAQTLRADFMAGKPPVDTPGTFQTLANRTIETYYAPMSTLLSFMDISDFEALTDGSEAVLTSYPGPLSWQYQPLAAPLATAVGPGTLATLASWPFTGSGTSAFTVHNPATVVQPAAAQMTITTSPGAYDVQYEGAVVSLGAGSYMCQVDATIAKGGMMILVKNVDQDGVIGTSRYYQRQMPVPVGERLAVPFELAATTNVQVMLLNWSLEATSSRWLLRWIGFDAS